MKLFEAIHQLGYDKSMQLASRVAENEKLDWKNQVRFVFHVVASIPARIPRNIGDKDDTEAIAIRKWMLRFNGGYENRATQRVSRPPGTIADPAIERIIAARLTKLTDEALNRITYAHRLAMSAENIQGLILEEYLFENLKASGWHIAWGETVRAVDAVHEDGRLLQIKNRSNSENSSSSSVRDGTKIDRWYRIEAQRLETKWDKLNEICKTNHLSEEAFQEFLKQTITTNPKCLAVEDDNPWDE